MTGPHAESGSTVDHADPASSAWDVAFIVCCGVVAAALWLDLMGIGTGRGSGAVVAIAHLAATVALYVYARPRAGKLIAFGVGLVFLLLPTGGEGGVFDPGPGWVVASAAGAWALVITLGPLPIRGAWVAALLLALAVAMSGIALAFLVAITSTLLPSPRRTYLWIPVPASIAFVGWFIVLGSSGQGVPDLTTALESARAEIIDTIGLISGTGPDIGMVLATLLVLATLANVVGGSSIRLGLVAGTVGIVVLFIAVVVAQEARWLAGVALEAAAYPAAVFFLVAITSWLAHRPLDVAGRRLRLATVVAVLTSVAVVGSR